MDKLARLTWEGAAWRYPDGVPEEVANTIRHEFELIDRKKIAPYFLTVHEIVWQARKMGILCQGRGSAANSAVCYCLGITSVNPDEDQSSVRALPVQRAQRTTRHRRRFRARAARGDHPVDLQRERPLARRAGGHGDRLPQPQRHPRGRQGARPVARHGGRDGRHGVGHGLGRRRCRSCARGRPRSHGSPAGMLALELSATLCGFPAPSLAACRRLRADRRSARRAGADPERGHGGPYRHRMGQGRSGCR